MAVQDPTKKKRELIPTTGAFAPDYGQPQGGGGGGGGIGSPGAAATPAAPDPVGYGAGAALRESAKNVAIQGGLAAAKATAPYLKSVIAGANFMRGLLGASPGAPASSSPQPTRQLPGAAAPATPAAQPARGGVGTSNGGGSAGAGATSASTAPRRALLSDPIYNDGTGATYTTGDGRVGQLPAGVAVVRQKDGTNAFGATGASVAAATGNAVAPAAVTRALTPAAVPQVAAAQTQTAPAVYGRSLSGDVSGAERERAAALSNIDNQLLRVKPNTRGRREFIAELLGLKRQLTGQRVDQATTLATQGAQLDNTAAIEAAQLAQRTGEGNANRALDAQRINVDAQTQAADLQSRNQGVSRLLLDSNGNTSVLRNDGSLDRLNDASGNAFQQAPDPESVRANTVSPDTQYRVLNDRLTQLQQFGPAEGQQDAYNQEVADLQSKLAALEGGGGASKKTVVRTGTQGGRKVVQYSDGSIEYAD